MSTGDYRVRAAELIAATCLATDLGMGLLFRQLSDDIVYFSHTVPPNDDEAEKLTARGVRVIDGEVASLEVVDDRLTGVRLRRGVVVDREALVVATRMAARAGFLADLGLRPTEHPSGMGERIPADATGRTEVPGAWVAGNVTDLSAQVGAAASAGAFAAAQINADLVAEETRQAVTEYQASPAVSHPFPAASEG